MKDKNYTTDPNSGLDIRRTDNTPKDEDVFIMAHQSNSALSDEEASAVLADVLKHKEDE